MPFGSSSRAREWKRAPEAETSSSRVSSDMNKRKKVKFLDPVTTRTERIPSPSAGDAKTSEYKCFKRLLGEYDPNRHCNQIPKDNINLKTFKVSNFVQDKNDSVTDAKRSSSPIQNVTAIAKRLPSARIAMNFEPDNGSKYKSRTPNSPSPVRKLVPDSWRSPLSPGPKKEYEGTFSKKRKNLLQLVAETSSRKVGEISSNKSELISEYLQRLGVGRKLGKFDELSKPGPKVSSDGYHSPSSLKSHKDNKELQVTVQENEQPSLRRKWEKGLLNLGRREADELIALPVDQVSPISYAFEAGFQRQKRQPISVPDEKRISSFCAQNKSTSTSHRGWCKTDDVLSKGVELITLPHDCRVGRAFPTSIVLDSDLHGIQWHSNRTFDDDDELFENKTAFRERGSMSHVLPETSEFVSLLNNHAIDRMLSNADALASLPSDVMLQSLPALHVIEFGMEYERGNNLGSNDHLLSKFEHRISENLPCRRFEQQSIVPHIDSTSSYRLTGQDLYSELTKEQCTTHLLECQKEHPEGLDCLALAPYGASNLRDRREVDVSRRRNNFSSSPSSYHLFTPTAIDLERERCWSVCTKNRFNEEPSDGGLGCIETRSRFDGCEDEGNLMEFESYFPGCSSIGGASAVFYG